MKHIVMLVVLAVVLIALPLQAVAQYEDHIAVSHYTVPSQPFGSEAVGGRNCARELIAHHFAFYDVPGGLGIPDVFCPVVAGPCNADMSDGFIITGYNGTPTWVGGSGVNTCKTNPRPMLCYYPEDWIQTSPGHYEVHYDMRITTADSDHIVIDSATATWFLDEASFSLSYSLGWSRYMFGDCAAGGYSSYLPMLLVE